MANAQDILLDTDWDLLISGGDFVTGSSDEQSAALLVVTAPGHWKDNPFLGFNAALYVGSNTTTNEMRANLIEQLASDNALLDSFLVEQGVIIDLETHRTIV
jgi:hypothetical protein